MAVGSVLALAVVLGTAGAPKLVRPDHVAAALRRVFDPRRAVRRDVLITAGRLLGAWELALAVALLVVGGPPSVAVAAAAAATCAGFTGFVVAAIRRGSSCGCWASLSDGPAGGSELGRAAMLAVAAIGLLVLRATGRQEIGVGPAALGWAAVTLALMSLAAVVGGRLLPVRSAKVARRLALRAAPTRLGRALTQLSFLGGFVHTGTDAQRRRHDLVRSRRLAGCHRTGRQRASA